ncbi:MULTISPECIES: spore germination protein [Neobacillus]|jgi:spore germination protein PF|uniref:Spore germination protein n=2 Tax=Neobacillus TaxID=2675232 RepID=A0A6B3TPT3_9BACI|nr:MULTISPECIES: spore germination protein [Neobacillus]AIM17390.1 spore gernimation protein GerPF [Bacillus sp. X1(2014)]MCD4837793.1 spore germination protein [Neobacillus sedimentimangrovi]MED3623073.1 spore germination protein [Neobacillus thermocopriae]MED3714968.1 spore germination protein [Neobacillus thermocopriae]NEX78823.1 spore germination protein [Neobacillus thermocopriae]
MPAIIGPVQIVNVTGGIVHFGDTVYISPKSGSKTSAGSGGFNTGGLIVTNNGLSGTNVLDTDLIDQPITGNG